MKYFKKQLWIDMNNFEDENIANSAFKQWDINQKQYWEYIQKIKPQLSKKAQQFFTKVSLHDGTLISFSVGDVLNKRSHLRYPKNNFAEIKVLKFDGKHVYILRYSKIRACKMDYPGDPVLFLNDNLTFNDWGYDELCLLEDQWLRHDILFASGATISIEFMHFNYSRDVFKKP